MKKLSFSFLAAYLFTLNLVFAQWEQCNNGLYGGTINCLAIYNDIIYAGTNGGGIFISTNDGNSWREINNGLTNLYVNSVSFGINKILVGTKGGVFFSTNNGNNWTHITNGLTDHQVYCSETDSNNIFVGGMDGLHISRDDGTNWSLIKFDTVKECDIYAIAIKDNSIFVGTSNKGVYLSTDLGYTWSQDNDGLTKLYVKKILIDSNQIYIGTYSGIFYSALDTIHWNEIDNDLLSKDINYLTSDNNNLYACTNGDGIYFSTNKGANWNQISNGLTFKNVKCLGLKNKMLFAGTINGGIFLSDDNGSTWLQSNNGISNLTINCLAKNNKNIFAGTNEGGIFLSTDCGNSWNPKNDGLSHNSIWCLATSNNNIFAVNSDGINLSMDNGNSWEPINDGLTNRNVSCIAIRNNYIFAGIFGNGVFLSSNNGSIWDSVNNGISNANVSSIAINGDNIYAGTFMSGGIFLSTNNGYTWTPVNNGIGQDSFDISQIRIYCLANKGNYMFASTQTLAYISSDTGKNWEYIFPLELQMNVRNFHVIGNNVYANVYNKIYVSKNNGINWSRIDSEMIYNQILCIEADGNYILVGTQGKGIYKALGTKFIKLSIGAINDIVINSNSIKELNLPITVFNPQMLGFSVSSDNMDLIPNEGLDVINSDTVQTLRLSPAKGKTGESNITINVSDGVDTVSTSFKVIVNPLGVDDLNPNNSEFIISPNPASDLLFVQQAQEINTKYEIINLLGSKVLSGEIQGRSTTINIAQLPQGLYFLRIGNETKKFVKE